VRVETAESRRRAQARPDPTGPWTGDPTAGPTSAPERPMLLVGGRTVVLRATDAAGRVLMMKGTVPASAPDGSATPVVLPIAAVELAAVSADGMAGSVNVGEPATGPIVVELARK
ncbi:MAG: hypothetical protein WAT39_22575, partial [Planctomycetota bacterium]